MAQLGRALPWGGRGREFKSRRSDHYLELQGFRGFQCRVLKAPFFCLSALKKYAVSAMMETQKEKPL